MSPSHQSHHSFLKIALVLLWLYPFCQCNLQQEEVKEPPIHHEQIQVALYIENSVWPNCKLFTENLLRDTGFNYTIINRSVIINGDLENYSVLLMPGGDPSLYEQELGHSGKSQILSYVRRGGGYFGICGGAYYAADISVWKGWAGDPRIFHVSRYLALFSGMAMGPVEEFAPTYVNPFCQVEMINQAHPVASNLADLLIYYYDHGPEFRIKKSDRETEAIGISREGNRILILCSHYDAGRIFLTSGHPEVDTTDQAMTMVKNAIRWCSKLDNGR